MNGRELLCAVCTLLFCVMRDARSTPFIERNLQPADAAAEAEESTNDAGPLHSCVVPDAPVCGVDYLVPGSVATIAAAIERDITALFDSPASRLLYGDDCAQTAKMLACVQRFPRCEVLGNGDVQVELTSPSCEDTLLESCSEDTTLALVARGHCALRNSTHEATECKSVAEYAADAAPGDLELLHCTQDQQWQMTAWMYELLLYYDALFDAVAEELRDLYGECAEHQSNFTCQMVGKCSDDGQRVELVNTYEICQGFINCFPDGHANRLRERFNCNQWPHSPPSTAAPPSTTSAPPSTTPSKDPTTPISTWPPPPEVTLDPVIGGTSHTLAGLTLYIDLIAVILLHTL